MNIWLKEYLFFWHSLFKPYQFYQSKKYASLFNTVEKSPFTPAQRKAIILNDKNSLVIAGAGTGKTSTIIGKVAYLIKSKKAKEHEILLLAFNRDAADELRDRIKSKVGANVTAKTFHSLGNGIIKDTSTNKHNISQFAGQEIKLKEFLNDIVLNEIKKDGAFEEINRFFSEHSITGKNAHDFTTLEDYSRSLRTQKLITLNGEYVKSFGELIIANYLFCNSIQYEYEAHYKPTLRKEYSFNYRPDFYLPDTGQYLEYYGINRLGETAPYIDRSTYNKQIEDKRKLHNKEKTTCLELFYYDLQEDKLTDRLSTLLEQHNIEKKAVPHDLMLKMVVDRKYDTRLTKLLVTFLKHYKSNANENSIDTLKLRSKSSRDKIFIKLFQNILMEYEKKLSLESEIDFEDMIEMATLKVSSGLFKSPWKYIIVDEFQDISRGRYFLIKALQNQVKRAKTYCVGDDWQAINRFAGADLNLMKYFKYYFGKSSIVKLNLTFRFNNKIAHLSEKFVTRNPSQFKKRIKSLKHERTPQVCLYWNNNDPENVLIPFLSALPEEVLHSGKSLQILARYSFNLPERHSTQLKQAQKIWSGNVLPPKTIHSSKGLEADYVVVLDVNSDFNGFPSEKHDDPVLNLVMPNADSYKFSEERRLMYVALTRACEKVYLITQPQAPSEFILELMEKEYFTEKINQSATEGIDCPICKSDGNHGKIINIKDNFHGCSNYPICNYRAASCNECEGGYYHSKDNSNPKLLSCSNNDCDSNAEKCGSPKCDGGVLVLKGGFNNKFWGCHLYQKTGCKYIKRD